MRRMRLTSGRLLVGVSLFASAMSLQAAPARLSLECVQIVAEKMCCKGCARKVSGQLYAARGVKEVGVDLSTNTVTVTLPSPSPAVLGQLWAAVEKGEGGPTKLVTAEATYSLIQGERESADATQKPTDRTPLTVTVDNLHCKGCAKKIAAHLYAIKGVTKVSVDMQQETLVVEARPGSVLSPWQLVVAVRQANERPLVVSGPHGTLAIEWAAEAKPKHHQQAQQTTAGGIQR